jgi:UDP-N-acetylglucosamine diphosphorylase / glucose-1-phosphate thymidylyltransferase / UDP-N-acetylgalactosamine diphosphorylase / glucosamine-1-phosphate N-acetyltransferase / galactosamine-1-phosphate N-acetyltransferase
VLAVVLAAGKGTRLRPLTDARSKAMMPIAGQPMLARVLGMLESGGCKQFVIVTHPDDQGLIEHFTSDAWAGRLQLVFQHERRGMAHALACAVPAIRASGAEDFVLAACDNLYPERHVAAMLAGQLRQGLDATLSLMHVAPEVIPTLAVVELKAGLVTRIVEKPRPEDAPSDLGVPALYVLSRRALDVLPRVPLSARGELEFPDVLRLLIEDGGRVGGVLVERRMTLTRPADPLALNRAYLQREPSYVATAVAPHVELVQPVRIDAGVELGAGCVVGPEVYLESGCHIGAGAAVRRSVVLRGAVVAAGEVLEDKVAG